MTNEFGYIDDKPFKICNTDKQTFTTISTDDDGIEFKISGVNPVSIFDLEKIPKAIYAVDSKLTAITALRINPTSTSFSAISTSKLRSDLYFVKQGVKGEEDIKHFTANTKIKELHYYNDSIDRIFYNDAYKSEYKLNKNNTLKYIKISGKSKKSEKIGEINLKENTIELFVNKDFSVNYQYENNRKIILTNNTHLIIKYKKGVTFEEVYNTIMLLDTTIYLMTFLKRRHKNVLVKDFKKNKYVCNDWKRENTEKKIKDRRFLICDVKDSKNNFINILKNIYVINDKNKNALFPFLEFDTKQFSLEIKFLEYYKAIEYIKYQENIRNGKGKNKLFMGDIIKNNTSLKNRFFKTQSEDEIEEEIRELRNYFSHEGYYIDKLPIKEGGRVKREKIVNRKWLNDVFEFTRICAYIEIYKLCEIDVSWEDIINNF